MQNQEETHKTRLKEIFFIIVISVIPIFLIYLPFILKLKQFLFLTIQNPGIFNIFRNWDGPNFLMVARTWYDLDAIGKRLFIPVDVRYFAAHFPLFPLFIALLSTVVNSLYAGILVNIVFGFLLNFLFYSLAKKYTKHPLFLTLVFTIFPPRYWVLRSVIAAETLMLFFVLFSLYLWEKKQYALSSVLGFFGVLTKVQALFLFPAYVLETIEKKMRKNASFDIRTLWMGFIPLAFVGLSVFFYLKLGDFLAFFHAEKGNNLNIFFPFSQFNYRAPWGGFRLEDVIFYFTALFICIATLWKRKERSWFYFVLSYTIFLVFVPHEDIARYAFPLFPIVLLTFESFFTSKVFKWAFICILPALYFYAINFILVNQAPIADWSLLLK